MEYVAYKFRLYPTHEQQVFFQKSFGCIRKVWNLMLQQFLQTGRLVGYAYFKRMSEFSYLAEVDSLGLANVKMNLQQALLNHKKNPSCFGMPRFKSKKLARKSYTTNKLSHNNIRLSEKYLRLPKVGLVRCKRHRSVPENYVLKSVTVSCNAAGQYYASILFTYELEQLGKTIDVAKSIGFDYKSDGLIVDSNGGVLGSPKYYRRAERRLAKQQRKLARKQKDSKNHEKQRKIVARLHLHVFNQRKNFLHVKSAEITNRYDIICIEDLNMKSLANKGFGNGKATLDNGFGMFATMLAYKSLRKGKKLIKIDKWFPSSQLCSTCGHKESRVRDLRIRKWTCSVCGALHDRDLNAAKNILSEGLRLYANGCQ